MMQELVLSDSLEVPVSHGFVRPKPLAQSIDWAQNSRVEKEIDTEVCKELVRRQLVADGLLSRSLFLGSWQVIFWPRKQFFRKGSWPVSFRIKVFNYWVVGPFEIRHYVELTALLLR